MKRITVLDRIGATCGAAYVVLSLVGNQLDTGGNQAAHPTGAQDLADFSKDPTVAQAIGFRLELLGMVALVVFVAWLAHALRTRARDAGWIAGVCTVSGSVLLAVKLGSGAPILAGQLNHAELSPTTARILADMNGGAFVISFLPAALFVLAAAVAARETGLLGRVAFWSGVVIGVLGLVMPLATGLDPINTNPLAFLAGLVWILCVSVRLAWRGPHMAARTDLVETTAALA